MSSFCEINVELLACSGSNYASWSVQVLAKFRAMGPRVEQVVVASFLPPNIDMDDFSSIPSKDLDSLQLNAQVTYYLFSTWSKEMQDVILEEEDICEDAHLIWKILEEMYAKTPCDDLFIEAEMSSEECSSPPPTFYELQVTFKKN